MPRMNVYRKHFFHPRPESHHHQNLAEYLAAVVLAPVKNIAKINACVRAMKFRFRTRARESKIMYLFFPSKLSTNQSRTLIIII